MEHISQTRGCNYYSVKSSEDFMKRMDDDFEYMVTPLVFDLVMKIKCEGSAFQIDKVYGSNNKIEKSIMENGEVYEGAYIISK